jgi:hypothetical protein
MRTIAGALFLVCMGCTPHVPPHERDERQVLEVPVPEQVPAPEPEVPVDCLGAEVRTPLRRKPHAAAIGDLDGDDRVDVVMLSWTGAGLMSRVMIARGGADGGFVEVDGPEIDGNGVLLADVDADRDPDVIVLDAGGKPRLTVLLNDRGELTPLPAQTVPGAWGGELAEADAGHLDGDAHLDLVVPLWKDVRVMLGDGRGGFRAGQSLPTGRSPRSPVIVDIDGDWIDDLVVASEIDASVHVFRGRGAARFTAWQTLTVADDPQQVLAIPVLPTLRPELVVAHGSSQALSLVHFDGQTFVPGSRHTAASDGRVAAVDLDGLGRVEIVSPLVLAGHVLVYRATDDGGLEAIERHRAGSFPLGAWGAEVTGDAHRDLILVNAGPPGPPYGAPDPSIGVLAGTGCPGFAAASSR